MSDVEAVEHLAIAYALARPTSTLSMQRSPVPRSSYLPLSELRGWAEYDRLVPDFDYSIHMKAREFQLFSSSSLTKRALSFLKILASPSDSTPE
ncbi:hypothetical protein EDD85DRAFT_867647 [Armillaria nabsnona]|nr:hypothetical protein EDD85DRAFT_867647 [Armillaria nabsnona]